MSSGAAKRAVTSYFRGRAATLRLLNRRRLSEASDYLELYVLVRLARLSKGSLVTKTLNSKGRRVFEVAGSPSPSWAKASYVMVKGMAARTGLQVQCQPGSVELDVVLVVPSLVDLIADRVPAKAAKAAFECKLLTGRLKTTHANEMLGKAHRVWALPVPNLTCGSSVACAYTAIAPGGASAGLDLVLKTYGIGMAPDLASVDARVQEVLDALV
jgi:hypothetical protein